MQLGACLTACLLLLLLLPRNHGVQRALSLILARAPGMYPACPFARSVIGLALLNRFMPRFIFFSRYPDLIMASRFLADFF